MKSVVGKQKKIKKADLVLTPLEECGNINDR